MSMSRQQARSVLDQISGRPSLIVPRYATGNDLSEVTSGGLFADLRDLAAADSKIEQERWGERKSNMLAAYGLYETAPDDKPFAFADGKAIIPVHGILINRFSWSWSFVTGYNFIRDQVDAAMSDDDVDGIIYDHNSYGGMVSGCQETSDLIYSANRKSGGKPSVAVVDANCFSAAYMLACSADSISVTSSGETGSIGVVQMHVDLSAALEKQGVKVTFQYAGDHKVDGSPFSPLSDEAKKDRQTKIDAVMKVFVGKVTRGRGLSEQAVRDTQARCVSAEEALSLGLIDAIQAPDDAVTAFFKDEEPENGDDDGVVPDEVEVRSNNMATEKTVTTNPAATPAVTGLTAAEVEASNASARTAERQRIAGIHGHAEATDRGKLASHLALNTGMSVEEAGAILAVAAKETPVPAAKTEVTSGTSATAGETNHFQNAMNSSKHPNVGAGGGADAGSGDAGMTPAQRLLANQRAIGGNKATSKPVN